MASQQQESESSEERRPLKNPSGVKKTSIPFKGSCSEQYVAVEGLPEGWRRREVVRKKGASAGRTDVYFLSPSDDRLRSRTQVMNYLNAYKLKINLKLFNFAAGKKGNTSKRPSTKRRSAGPAPEEPPRPASEEPPRPSTSSTRPDIIQPDSHSAHVSQTPNPWIPPKSPYNLIQETLFDKPWQLLVATILLNKSPVRTSYQSGEKSFPLIYDLFRRWPTPESMVSADVEELAHIIESFGNQEKRAYKIKRFSEGFLTYAWRYPIELYGIGSYGNDSYRIFCVNEWQSVHPKDMSLNMYRNWLINNWQALCEIEKERLAEHQGPVRENST